MGDFFSFRFKPGRDTGFAIATFFLFWLAYFLNVRLEILLEGPTSLPLIAIRLLDILQFVIWIMFGNIFISVFFPVAVVTHEMGDSIASLGVRRDNLPAALVASVLVAGGFVALLLTTGSGFFTGVKVLTVLETLLLFAQPFFVFGWLQSRFRRAFGAIPAIVLAAGLFTLYHVGSVAPSALLGYATIGGLMALAVGITNNVFAAYPLAWGVLVGLVQTTPEAPPVTAFFWLLILLGVQAFAFTWLQGHARDKVKNKELDAELATE